MSRYTMTDQAVDDPKAIWQYIADRAGEGAAEQVGDDLIAAFEQLGDMPGMGHVRADVPDDRYRFWSAHSYVIAYHPDVRPIRIVRVVGGQQDFGRLFRRP